MGAICVRTGNDFGPTGDQSRYHVYLLGMEQILLCAALLLATAGLGDADIGCSSVVRFVASASPVKTVLGCPFACIVGLSRLGSDYFPPLWRMKALFAPVPV
jgi:hypothetical protein